ncbi:Ulp1 protease family, catalytic domain protein [Ancylostoma caninum]|uniref:Ulp1 protease family, catalytic domain protein n=1 Tax=Ancylostoma caninum TaxID=29170 RepID=A0A368HDV6_ANCCA|nr:Ulp1 protease family, catalytic domain protein [Ancylostoma caninum]
MRTTDRTPPVFGNAAAQNERKNNLPIELPQSVIQNRAAESAENKANVASEGTPSDAVPSRSDLALSIQKDLSAAYSGGDEMVVQQCGTERVVASSNQETAADSAYMVAEEIVNEEWSGTLESDSAERTRTEQAPLPPETCGDSLNNDVLESSSNEDYSSTVDRRHMTAAEFLRTFSCSDSQIIDFPEDFLAPDTSSESKETPESKPPTAHHTVESTHEELTVDDDDLEKEEPTSLKFEGDVTVDVGSIRQSMPIGAFMTGSFATFYFKHYIPYVALKDAFRKDKICFFDSWSYEFIRRKCQKESFCDLDEDVTVEMAVTMFGRRKKKRELHAFIMNLIEFELVVIPLFWDNHWLLGLLQIFPSSGEDSLSGRLVLIDSKFDDPVNKVVLERISESIHCHIGIAIKAALVTSDKPRHLKDFALIRCDSLPCQTNNSDCGWFMCLFAEYYTKNINWMALSNEQVRSMSLSLPEEEKFLARLKTIKREVGAYIERAAKRPLYFEYDKVVQATPTTK